MKYILFVLIFSSKGPVVYTKDFNSELACRMAVYEVDSARVNARIRESWMPAPFCVADTKAPK